MPHDVGESVNEDRQSRPWAVRFVGLLLLLQAIANVALAVYLLLPFDWRATAEQDFIMSPQQLDALSLGFLLIPTAILVVLSAIGFLLLRRGGWLLAMAMQGATLLGCLTFYFDTRPPAIFPVMVYCIIMAFYLNTFDVRVTFQGGGGRS